MALTGFMGYLGAILGALIMAAAPATKEAETVMASPLSNYYKFGILGPRAESGSILSGVKVPSGTSVRKQNSGFTVNKPSNFGFDPVTGGYPGRPNYGPGTY